jgi:hypothetical protein
MAWGAVHGSAAPANPGAVRGGLAVDRRALRVSDFLISENLESYLSAQEK